MAQVVAHLIGNEEVTGSTPVISLQEDDPSDHPFFVSKSAFPVVWTAKRPGKPGRQSPYIRWGLQRCASRSKNAEAFLNLCQINDYIRGSPQMQIIFTRHKLLSRIHRPRDVLLHAVRLGSVNRQGLLFLDYISIIHKIL